MKLNQVSRQWFLLAGVDELANEFPSAKQPVDEEGDGEWNVDY